MSRNAEPVHCIMCEKAAVRLCDAPIGYGAIGAIRDEHFRVVSLVTGAHEDGHIDVWTCDAPLCEDHAKQIGQICGHGPSEDTIDRCPYHIMQDMPRMSDMIMFSTEVSAVRRAVHADIRRWLMRQSVIPASKRG